MEYLPRQKVFKFYTHADSESRNDLINEIIEAGYSEEVAIKIAWSFYEREFIITMNPEDEQAFTITLAD